MIERVRRALQRWGAARRCIIGRESVVYPSARILPNRGDRTTIALGAHTHVRGELLTLPGGRIEIGDWCYVGEQTRIWSASSIRIGHRVLIAHLVTILDNLTHPIDAVRRHEQFVSIVTRGHPADVDLGAAEVTIGDDAWIGCGCVVLRGVRIGEGAIVAAGSVVTKSVPPWTLVAGNPARAVRSLDPRRPAGAVS